MANQFLVINARVKQGGWNTPAAGPAGLHRLDRAARRASAAHFVDDLRERDAHRHFDQAAVANFAHDRKNLGAFALLGAELRKGRRAVSDDPGHVSECLDVVDHRRATPESALRRERRTHPRHAARAFDGLDQRRFLAADKRPRAFADFDVELFSQQPGGARLFDGQRQPFDRQRILGAHVNETGRRADGERADRHAFNHAMRIAFHHAAIHERARIPFVAVADDVFLFAGRLGGVFPLQPGQETCAAASAQTAGGDQFDDLRRRHPAEHLAGGAITAGGAVRIERFRVNRAAIFQRDLFLFGQKAAHTFGAPGALEQIFFHRLVASDVAVENLPDAALIQMHVGPVLAAGRIKFEHRFAVTKPGAAGFVQRDS